MDHQRFGADARGTTAVVGVVLLVAVAVVAAATVGSVVLSASDHLGERTPPTARSTGAFETGPSVGCGDNVVRVVHDGGEPLSADAVEVVVRVPERDASARLVDLPVDGTSLGPENVVGDRQNVVYDNCVGGVVANGGKRWAAGREIAFELNAGGGTVTSGDEIEVLIVHEPTDGVVANAVVNAA